MLIRPNTGLSPLQRTRLSKDLISWWPFDDLGGAATGNTYDVFPNSPRTVTGLVAAPAHIAQAYNGQQRLAAAVFSGGAGTTTGAVSYKLPSSTWNFSVTAWVYAATASSVNTTIYDVGNATVGGWQLAVDGSNFFKFTIKNNASGGSPSLSGINGLIQRKWYFVAGTYDGTNSANGQKIWVNGIVENSQQVFTPLPNSTAITSGNPAIINTNKIYVDDLRVYWRELSAGDIRAIMAEALGPVPGIETIAMMNWVPAGFAGYSPLRQYLRR